MEKINREQKARKVNYTKGKREIIRDVGMIGKQKGVSGKRSQ